MRAFVTLIAVLWLLPGGGAAQPIVQPETGIAELCFYRRGSFARGRFELWINGVQAVAPFQGGTYFSVQVPAGQVELQTKGRPAWAVEGKRFRLEAEAGQTYYIEAVLDYDLLVTALYLVQRERDDFLNRAKTMSKDEKAKRKVDE